MPAMTFAQAVISRIENEDVRIVINDRTVYDLTPNGHMTNVQDEICIVEAATEEGGLHLRRLKYGDVIIWQWHHIGSLRIVKGTAHAR